MPTVSSTRNIPSPQKDFHAFFNYVASKDERKDRASAKEIKAYIFADILGRDPKTSTAISFNDFGEIRKVAGAPFANRKLGYWLRNQYAYPVGGHDSCGTTHKSGDAIADQYMIDLFTAIQPYSDENVFLHGVTEKVLQNYYEKNKLLHGPIKTVYSTVPLNAWSQRYDVGSADELFRNWSSGNSNCKDHPRSDPTQTP